MPLPPGFPADPYDILLPDQRWYPGEQLASEAVRASLIPPLVDKVRREVQAWRDGGYQGASATTRALLRHWFDTEHYQPDGAGNVSRFRWYFAQREAAESAIWLHEVAMARSPHALMAFDSSQMVSRGMFLEDWPRYVLKLATGAGKTKVMNLLMVWSYFHKRYEAGSPLSANILLIAPNIIVLDRLKTDFEGGRIFFQDPLLPPNGFEGRNWQDDFQMTVHIQDEVGRVSPSGNLFLTNIHRVYSGDATPASFEDADTTDYFLGPRPVTSTTDRMVDLGQIVREVDDLIVINDEAHHVHQNNAWFKAIEEIALKLRQKGRELSAQIDLSATPKHNNGAIFVQTVCDYPLVEAIRQGVVKRPVLPDAASRAELKKNESVRFTERYEKYIHLGYTEWKASFEELSKAGKKPVLFVMTEDTRTSDEVAEFLEARYPEFSGAVLVIHTKNNGEISEKGSAKDKAELDRLRRESREIDSWENKHKAIVSVMVLREGWDVRNVTVIVGLRAFTAENEILPEQAMGRGLRLMFPNQNVDERVSIIGTPQFMELVERLTKEGVELAEVSMGAGSPGQGPLFIEVDNANPQKDIAALDIAIPVLSRRYEREYKRLDALDVSAMRRPRLPLLHFTADEQREIVFKHIDDGTVSHVQRLELGFTPSQQNVLGFFAREILREARMVGGFDVLYGKLKQFAANHLFEAPADLDDLNTLRNLSEPRVIRALHDAFREAINALTVVDRGSGMLNSHIRLSEARPAVVERRDEYRPRKSVFNRIVGDSGLELDFASFLDGCPDVLSFAKIGRHIGFKVEYRKADGAISDYVPDFIVKHSASSIWIVETKGREDIDDAPKRGRLEAWVEDATAADPGTTYRAMYLKEDDFATHRARLTSFADAIRAFVEAAPNCGN